MCIQLVSEGNDVFLWLPMGYSHKSSCCEVLPFVFDYQFKRDNSAVLVVSPLLSLMMDQVDGVQAEMAGFRYRLERCHACTNWWRCVKPRPCNLMSTSVISFCSHVFSAIKFVHARTVCTRLSFFLATPPPVFRVTRREPGDEAKSNVSGFKKRGYFALECVCQYSPK